MNLFGFYYFLDYFLGYFLGSANAERFESGHFGSCEHVSASVSLTSKGLCPFETYDPFKKVSIPNFLDRFSKRSTHTLSSVFPTTREFFGSDLSTERKAEFCANAVRHKKKNLHV